MRNIVIVGDELVAGHGDPKGQGWVGRVAGRTIPHDPDVRFHIAAVPGETTSDLGTRWVAEVQRRIESSPEDAETHLVVAVGRHDVLTGVSPTITRLNLANLFDRAQSLGMKPMLAGPPPIATDDGHRIAQLAAVCEDAAARRNVPYVDMYGPIARNDQWQMDMELGDGFLPRQAGYGLLAWLVLHSAWFDWLGIEQPDQG